MMLPESKHFELVALADGVYAAIATPDGAAYSNAGIIDLGDRTLIFDTFDTVVAGRDLLKAAEALTGRSPDWVINSHAHSDHWAGNQLFRGATIITTYRNGTKLMPEHAGRLREWSQDLDEFAAWIEEQRLKLARTGDERWRVSLSHSIPRAEFQLASLRELDPTLPALSFDGQLVFAGSQRTAKLIACAGHTESDCYLLLADDEILFLGDLGFFQCQPFLPYADPPTLLSVTAELARSGPRTMVPGHGPVGGPADLERQATYITTLKEAIGNLIHAGGGLEQALALELPPPFDSWLLGGMSRFEANVRFFFDRLMNDENRVA